MINPRRAAAALAVSATAIISIAQMEDYKGSAYLDSVQVPTIGFGTTEGVKMGDHIDPVRALVRLQTGAEKRADEIRKCIGDVPLYQHEWDAYVSMSYNIGSSAFCHSTLLKKLKARDYPGACAEIKRWVYAGGKKLKGLEKRRAHEYAMCMGDL